MGWLNYLNIILSVTQSGMHEEHRNIQFFTMVEHMPLLM